MEMLYIMIVIENTQLYTFLNTHQNVQLKLVNFTHYLSKAYLT